MADVNRGDRPLSPHLSIYRPQMTTMTSIFVRITGVGLLVGAIAIVWWLLAAAGEARSFGNANGFLTSWFGDLLMTGVVWAAWYHLLGGLRHLVWDQIVGLDIETAEKMGWAMVIGSVVLTILTIIIV